MLLKQGILYDTLQGVGGFIQEQGKPYTSLDRTLADKPLRIDIDIGSSVATVRMYQPWAAIDIVGGSAVVVVETSSADIDLESGSITIELRT